MNYKKFLETIEKCPFCKGENRIIEENESAYLTYALAPYHPHHLLVIPKKHTLHFLQLNDIEDSDISDLIDYGASLLEGLGYKDYSILIRNGSSASIGKSIDHLHYHLIPNIHIGSHTHDGGERKILSPEEIGSLMEEITSVQKKLHTV